MFAVNLSLNWTTPFLLFGIYGAARYFIKGQANNDQSVNWKPAETVGITLLIYFISQLIAGIIVFVAPLLLGWSTSQTTDWLENNAYGQFIFVLIAEAIAIYMIYFFVKHRGANFKTIGLKKPRWRDLAYILAGWAVYFVSYLVILGLVNRFIVKIDTHQQQQIGFSHASGIQLPFVFAALVILPPLTEELLVRGFLYSGLRKSLHIAWAVFITSSLFAVAHLQPGNGKPLLWSAALDTFVLSLILIYIKEKTGSLAGCIGLHMLKNCIAFIGLFVLHLA